jgi:hypothetical protein
MALQDDYPISQSGEGSNADRLTRSPRAIREGNSDPNNIGPGEVQNGVKTSRDSLNAHAWEIGDEPDYKPLY